jgi:hypothetical protein
MLTQALSCKNGFLHSALAELDEPRSITKSIVSVLIGRDLGPAVGAAPAKVAEVPLDVVAADAADIRVVEVLQRAIVVHPAELHLHGHLGMPGLNESCLEVALFRVTAHDCLAVRVVCYRTGGLVHL